MSTYTQAELAALKAAFAKGVLSVSYDGQTVIYAKMSDLLTRISVIERSLNPTEKRTHYPTFSRGT